MEEGGGGESKVLVLLLLGRLPGDHAETVGVLGQGTSGLGWSVGVNSISTQDQLGAEGTGIERQTSVAVRKFIYQFGSDVTKIHCQNY